ncbi:MAG: hypothetical protein KGI06_05165 [Candidatus Micrarchaeota archaeon]|nr:hypothetical protein [Candidatus Micrarchaeota archaeon]
MPKTDKDATGSKGSWSNGLRLIASLFFLYVLFGGTGGSAGWWSPWVTNGAGSLWLPILFGAAVLSSIALFFSSITGVLFKGDQRMLWKTKSITTNVQTVAAFSLLALTVSPLWTSTFWLVVVGFILGWVANAFEMI